MYIRKKNSILSTLHILVDISFILYFIGHHSMYETGRINYALLVDQVT